MRKLLTNQYIFSILSKFGIVLVGFLFTVIQARYLGPTIKGQIAYVLSITSITSIILGFGIHQAYPFYKKTARYDILPVFIKLALLQFLIYLVIVIAAILLFSIHDPKIVTIFLVTPIAVYDRIVAYITMIEEPNKKNAIELIVNVLELVLIICLWVACPASFVIGALVVAFKDAVMAGIYTFRWRNRAFSKQVCLKGWGKRLCKFGFFPMLALLMTTLNYRVDVIMLQGRVADAYIGVYSIGVMLAERVWLIPDAMKDVMVSKVAKGKNATEVSYVIRICNTACFIVALVLALLGRPFINIIFGTQYSGAYQVTLILLIGVFFMIYYKMIASYNIVMGRQVINFIFLGVSVLGNIAANAVLIPVYGIEGAGVASVISYGICSAMFLVQFHHDSKIPLRNMLFATLSDLNRIKENGVISEI